MLRWFLKLNGWGGHTVDELAMEHQSILDRFKILAATVDSAKADREATIKELTAEVTALATLRGKM